MIFEKYSFKQKFTALLVIFLVLCYTAYKRSFSQLVSVVKENRELSGKVAKINDTTKDVNALESELASIDRIIGKEGTDKETIQQEIVSFVTERDNRISIYDLQSIHEYKDENYIIYTHQLDVTGNLNQLLALAYDFEKKFSYSRLVSQNFYAVKKNNNPDVLHLKMIFQNYENTK